MKYYVCAIIKDEHRYLSEWLEHCLNLGFNEIHLYEDFGSKSHSEITNKYHQVFLHSINEVTMTEYNRGDWKQVNMALHFISSHKNGWCAFIDPDEYIRFEDSYSLEKFCCEFQDYRGVYLMYKIYGANGNIERPAGGVVENYGNSIPMPYYKWKTNHKSLVNLSYDDISFLSVHHVRCGVYTDFHQRRHNSYDHPEKDLCYKKAWIDHYYTKSWQEWTERFTKRGDVVPANRKLDDFFLYNKDMMSCRNISFQELPLVFDVGCNNGDDAYTYINGGCKVVGVECSPKLVEDINKRFCDDARFVLENVCISDKIGETEFFVSTTPMFSSCNKNIAERLQESQKIKVKTTTLQSLFDKYGIPKYCKIDIEGNDIVALNSLNHVPQYISCETECVGKDETAKPFEIIDKLYSLGYNSFKLVNQKTMEVHTSDGVMKTKGILPWDLPLEWDDYKTCRELLSTLRNAHNFTRNWDFWYDVYAMRNDEIHTNQNADNVNKLFRIGETHWYFHIEKNGCSTLGAIATKFLENHRGLPLPISQWNNAYFKYKQDKPNGTIFAVWRDPIERFISFYSNKIKKASYSKHFSSLVSEKSLLGKSIDEVLDAIEEELSFRNPKLIDPHIRRQCDFYNVNDVDIIVPIQHLKDYLHSIGITDVEIINKSWKKPQLTEEQKERIKKLYANDYEIVNCGKIWQHVL